MKQYEICPAEWRDIKQIAAIERQIFAEPWKEEGFREALNRKENVFLILFLEGEIAGYGLCYTMCDEGEIPTIAISPQFQGEGYGKILLRELLKRSVERGVERIFLEVRESNLAARCLYEKSGFEMVGIRKDFYKNPKEDARLMRYQKK